jgi:hypothetical protein
MFRSRENRTTAEKELLGSVSDSVCELWDGRGIGKVISFSPGTQLLANMHDIESPLVRRSAY